MLLTRPENPTEEQKQLYTAQRTLYDYFVDGQFVIYCREKQLDATTSSDLTAEQQSEFWRRIPEPDWFVPMIMGIHYKALWEKQTEENDNEKIL